jgi:regulatory LuxR family protein
MPSLTLRVVALTPPCYAAGSTRCWIAPKGFPSSSKSCSRTLVIDGITSREIAARLYLSVRTVDKHVERLLAKTGVARRVQLRRLRT